MPTGDDANDSVNADDFAQMPPNLQKMVANIGFAVFENMPDEDREVFDHAREGRCMTCEGPLAEHANFIINRFGIVGGYCSGQCHSDMAVLGFIQEQHEDIMSAIRFRGGQGDVSEESDS